MQRGAARHLVDAEPAVRARSGTDAPCRTRSRRRRRGDGSPRRGTPPVAAARSARRGPRASGRPAVDPPRAARSSPSRRAYSTRPRGTRRSRHRPSDRRVEPMSRRDRRLRAIDRAPRAASPGRSQRSGAAASAGSFGAAASSSSTIASPIARKPIGALPRRSRAYGIVRRRGRFDRVVLRCGGSTPAEALVRGTHSFHEVSSVAPRRVARALALGSVARRSPDGSGSRRGRDTLPPDAGGEIESMGQPPLFLPYGGLSVGAYRPADDDDSAASGTLHLGLFKSITSPIAAVGIAGEGYLGARGSEVDGGVRALGVLRPFGLGIGLDYDIAGNDPDLILSFQRSFERGGLFGRGGMFRLNYLPTRDHTVSIGYQIPLGDSWMGRTRPKTDHVKLLEPAESLASPRPAAEAALADALARVRHAVEWQTRCVAPFLDQTRRLEAGGSRPPAREDSLLPGAHGRDGCRLPGRAQLSGGDPRLSRGARPRLLHRRERRRRGPGARGEQRGGAPDLRAGARDPARRGDPPLRPRARAHQEARHHARLRGPGARSLAPLVEPERRGPACDSRRCPLGVPAAAGPGGGEPAREQRGLGDLGARLAPDPARQTPGGARDPGAARRARRARRRAGVQPGQRAPLHRQREVPVGAASPHPGGRGLPRALDPRLPRQEQRRGQRPAGLRPDLPRLPEGTDRARPCLRHHRQAARLHDLPRPELLRAERRPDLDELPRGSPPPSGRSAERTRRRGARAHDPRGAGGAARGGRELPAPAGTAGAATATTGWPTASRCTSTSPIPWTGRSGASR